MSRFRAAALLLPLLAGCALLRTGDPLVGRWSGAIPPAATVQPLVRVELDLRADGRGRLALFDARGAELPTAGQWSRHPAGIALRSPDPAGELLIHATLDEAGLLHIDLPASLPGMGFRAAVALRRADR